MYHIRRAIENTICLCCKHEKRIYYERKTKSSIIQIMTIKGLRTARDKIRKIIRTIRSIMYRSYRSFVNGRE